MPHGVAKVPFVIKDMKLHHELHTEVIAGSVGMSIIDKDVEMFTVQPRSGWWMFLISQKDMDRTAKEISEEQMQVKNDIDDDSEDHIEYDNVEDVETPILSDGETGLFRHLSRPEWSRPECLPDGAIEDDPDDDSEDSYKYSDNILGESLASISEASSETSGL